MAGEAQVTTLYNADLRVVIRHLMGQPESARDRVGARHRRVLSLYCAGWCQGLPFAGLIRHPDDDAEVVAFGDAAGTLPAAAWRSIRLRALRCTPDAVWHHPFPLETAADYTAQETALVEHLRQHAADAGWTTGTPDETLRPAADPRTGDASFCLHPPVLGTASVPRWSPDPDEPPRYIRVFPGRIAYRGERYTVTGAEAVDPRDQRLLMAYRGGDRQAAAELWLNDQGRIVANTRPQRARDSSS